MAAITKRKKDREVEGQASLFGDSKPTVIAVTPASPTSTASPRHSTKQRDPDTRREVIEPAVVVSSPSRPYQTIYTSRICGSVVHLSLATVPTPAVAHEPTEPGIPPPDADEVDDEVDEIAFIESQQSAARRQAQDAQKPPPTQRHLYLARNLLFVTAVSLEWEIAPSTILVRFTGDDTPPSGQRVVDTRECALLTHNLLDAVFAGCVKVEAAWERGDITDINYRIMRQRWNDLMVAWWALPVRGWDFGGVTDEGDDPPAAVSVSATPAIPAAPAQ